MSALETFTAVKQIEKDVETQDTCLQSLVNSDSLIQTKLTYKIDTDLKNIATSIQKFAAEVVVESKPCEMIIVRRKAKQAQMMVAELSLPMSVENITKNVKTSTMFNETEHLIQEMFENIGNIRQNRDQLQLC